MVFYIYIESDWLLSFLTGIILDMNAYTAVCRLLKNVEYIA